MTATPSPPMEGLRILELSDSPCGAYCGRLLVLLGAELVKVEQPARRVSPECGEQPDLRAYVDSGKHGITLDLRIDAGRPLLRELIGISDAVICEHSPARAEALGVQYAVFEDVLPALVWLDLTPFGSDGPWADFAASALTVHAASGAQYIQPTGQLNAVYFGQRPPLKWGGHASEFLVATQAATALMAALFEREFRGRGQRLEISKQEALMQIIRSDIAEYANNGVVRSRAGSPQQGEILISGTMRCRDGYVAMWPLEPYMVVNLARLMGDPPWSKEAWFENPFERANHAAEIRKDIENWLLDFTMEEIHELGQTNRIAVTPVFSPKEVARSPQLASRGFFAEAYAADGRPFPLAGLPFPSDFGQPMAPPPEPGQDNLLVYRDILGLSLEELNRLEEAGVI